MNNIFEFPHFDLHFFYNRNIKGEEFQKREGEVKMKYADCKNITPCINKKGFVDFLCMHNTEDIVEATEEICKKCPHFESKRIKFPIQVSEVVLPDTNSEKDERVGKKVKLILTEDYVDENNETYYYGTFLGDIVPFGHYIKYEKDGEVLTIGQVLNPGIFVPDLNRMVCGSECFWEFVEE